MGGQEIAKLLRSCAKTSVLDGGIQLHGAVIKMGLGCDLTLQNDLVHTYGKCGDADSAHKVFDEMIERNVVSWATLIGGHLHQGDPKRAVEIFNRMRHSGAMPNEFTLSMTLKACGLLGAAKSGMQTHGLCIKNGCLRSPVIGNVILFMYSRSAGMEEARQVFDEMEMEVKNLASWNTMVGVYVAAGRERNALCLIQQMPRHGLVLDEFSYASGLKACSRIEATCQGSEIHSSMITNGLLSSPNVILSGALVDFYVKCGRLEEARKVFDRESAKSVIMWTALIVGYAQGGNHKESMDLFHMLWNSGIEIDACVLSGVMGVFSDFAMSEQGKQLHCYTVKVPLGSNISVSNSIIDMYLKCGLVEEAEKRFEEMHARNVVSWTVMINGYGKHGCGRDAVNMFNKMQQEGICPDEVTYLAVLSACSHSGLVTEGWAYFVKLQDRFKKEMKIEHYACMVDLLGRAGRLKEAWDFIEKMSLKATAGIWQTLLSACRVHRNVEMAKEVGRVLFMLDADNPVNHVMLSNIYVEMGEWEGCKKIRQLMKRKGLKKQGGCSWLELNKEVHYFYGGDDTHPLTVKILEVLKDVEKRLREEIGYNCKVRFALHDVDDETKEDSLRLHSEKLAVGLELLHEGLCSKRIIRVYKNLRVCVDCHDFLKGVSLVLKRVLIVRDANRFHKFESGSCSCGDYW